MSVELHFIFSIAIVAYEKMKCRIPITDTLAMCTLFLLHAILNFQIQMFRVNPII